MHLCRRNASPSLLPLSVVGPLHAGAPSIPIPHWVVLLAAVPALWLVIGAGVLAADRLLQRLGA